MNEQGERQINAKIYHMPFMWFLCMCKAFTCSYIFIRIGIGKPCREFCRCDAFHLSCGATTTTMTMITIITLFSIKYQKKMLPSMRVYAQDSFKTRHFQSLYNNNNGTFLLKHHHHRPRCNICLSYLDNMSPRLLIYSSLGRLPSSTLFLKGTTINQYYIECELSNMLLNEIYDFWWSMS